VWIKPFVVVPALACWLVSLVRAGSWSQVLADTAGLLLGGLGAGAGGLVWLWSTGAWADFWDIQLVWNREYVAFDYTEGERAIVWASLFLRFFPWMLVYLPAIPIALGWLLRPRDQERRPVLAALYLGWLAQVVLLQHTWDYLHVPALLLALTVVSFEAVRSPPGRQAALVAFLAGSMLLRLAPLTANRLPLWADCWREGSSPRLRNRLGLLHKVDWQALEQVRDFLRREGVADGELSCLSMGSMSLFLDPGVRPATRYLYLQNVLFVFAGQRQRILDDLAASRQRFLVVDKKWTLWKEKEPTPADGRVVFEVGPYRVHALTGGEMGAWARAHLELPNGR
jgi:hypothetical protein